MHRPEINLFRHPTTTVYIDDSTAFLYSITLGVDHQPFRSFSDPFAGLDYVEQYTHNYDQDMSDQPPSDSSKPASRLGHNFDMLVQRKLQNSVRFAEPSVVVIDYSMPQMNGLDLCSRITNPYVKKVLLTGVADEKIAIKALNTELIDFYISKSESTLSQELYRIISHLKDRYFQDIYGWTKDIRIRKLVPYLYNNEFADYFEDICERLNIVEHYPLETPWGFLLISSDGKLFHLAIAINEEFFLNKNENNLSLTAIEPVVITTADKSPTSFHCSVYEYTTDHNFGNVKSFSEYLQGPGLSIPVTRIYQESHRHDH